MGKQCSSNGLWGMRASGYSSRSSLYRGLFENGGKRPEQGAECGLYDALDHDPYHDEMRTFLGRLKTALSARDLTLFCVTTDGPAASPLPLRDVFGAVP